MERSDQQQPLNNRMLGDIATRCGAFSKALDDHALESQALTASCSPPRLVEALVRLHRALGQPEEALVVLTYAQQRRQDVAIKVSWLKKLGRWQLTSAAHLVRACSSYVRAQLVRARACSYVRAQLVRARAARPRTRSSSTRARENSHTGARAACPRSPHGSSSLARPASR